MQKNSFHFKTAKNLSYEKKSGDVSREPFSTFCWNQSLKKIRTSEETKKKEFELVNTRW